MNERIEFHVNLPNKPGQLARLGGALAKEKINIIAISGVSEQNPVIVLITDKEEESRNTFKKLGLEFKERELLTYEIPNKLGEISKFTKRLGDAKINVESIYLIDKKGDMGVIGFTVNDIEGAKKILGI